MEKRFISKLSGWIITFILLVMGATNGWAQNVTISPTSGSLVSGEMDGHDTGYALLLSSLWQHEQLSLTMTASDRDGLSEGGEITKPGSVLGVSSDGKRLTIIGGHRPSYLVVSLPKGYRITGYRLTLINDLVGDNVIPSQLPTGATQPDSHYRTLNSGYEILSGNTAIMRFYEVKPWQTDHTNSRCTGGTDGMGYNATQVRYIALGSNWEDGQIGTTESDVLATAAYGKLGDADYDADINPSDDGKEFYMERFGDDMGNQLYFRLVKNYSFYGLSIKSFEILFTAEGTFEADVTPGVVGAAQHVVKSPFLTSKLDIGKMELNTDTHTGAQRYTYNENNVKDIVAYTYLYQQGAVVGGKPTEDVDIPARINPVRVDNRDLYALGNDTYFIETPVEVETQSGWPAPVGYRIVGAKFNYLWGSDTDAEDITLPNAVQITSGNNRYLRTTDLKFQRGSDNTTVWQVDDHGNIYTGADNNRRYLSCYGDDENVRTVTTSTSATGAAAKWNLHFDETDITNHYVYYEDSHGSRYYLRGENNSSNTVQVVKNLTQNSRATYSQNGNGTHTIHIPAFHPGSYTLKVYDKEGNYAEDSDGNPTKGMKAVVSDESAAGGTLELKGLNNDAVKFEITGLTPYTKDGVTINPQALVSVTLQMQALDPYIDKMDIVCTDNNNVLELRQEFTANDFSVSGGKFIFYVPKDYAGQELTFTFKDLYSKYGDNTYYDGTRTGYSRYCYVTSEYFKQFDGYTDGNEGLYSTLYKNSGPNYPYDTKVYTSTAGNIRFKFNNAEDLGKPGAQNFLIENPFSVANYLNTTDPDFDSEENPGSTAEPAAFITCKLKAVPATDQNSDIFYVFTADETRWNIAPTTAWQHRAYAFYRMDIELRAKTFTPEITVKPIYEKTLYSKDGSDVEDSMWGIELETTDPDESGKKVEGYLSIQEILDHIKGREASGDIPAITGILDENGVNGPKSMKEILYIDATKLKSILNSSKTEPGSTTPTVLNLQTLRNEMAANALIFLPENTTSTLDNVAYKTSGVTYHAGKNIVLTDKQPFYSPYDIQVDPANHATYTRELTLTEYGKDENATIMLPFTLALENGLHTNEDGKCSFTVNTMEDGAQMATTTGGSVDYGTAFFNALTTSKTEANKPYMIHVESIEGTTSEGNTISFIASQKGSSIVKTPEPATTPEDHCEEPDEEGNTNVMTPIFSGKLIMGEQTNGKYKEDSYQFTNYASYSGGKFDRAVSEDVFYFAKNKYLNLHTLIGSKRYLMSYPFRGVYTYSKPTSDPTSGAKLMKGFYISYDLDEMEDAGFITRLEDLGTKADMMIRSGKGFITITATADQKFTIRNLSGMTLRNVNVNAGNTTTVNLPAGIYLVNNTKITVK